MNPLRQQMIDAMHQRGYSERTHQSYLGAVRGLARYFHQSPDQLQAQQIQDYFVYLVQERGLCGASCRMYLHAIRFLYLQVLHWPQFDIPITYPKKAQKIPELLTRAEVARIIQTCRNDKHQMMLLTCYGCGLRVSELTSLKVAHIDGERQVLRIEQGKGAKDRMVDLSSTLLDQLRDYWCQHQPNHWLFPNANTPSMHLSNGTIQRVFKRVKQSACIDKVGGIHGLRHAYATHQLENGMAIHHLQHQLGHNDLHSTLRYVHWLPSQSQDKAEYCDLIEQLALDHG